MIDQSSVLREAHTLNDKVFNPSISEVPHIKQWGADLGHNSILNDFKASLDPEPTDKVQLQLPLKRAKEVDAAMFIPVRLILTFLTVAEASVLLNF